MIKLIPIASGSKGNSMLIDMDERRVLIDLGVLASQLHGVLSQYGYTWDDIHIVLITHTHSDHIKGLDACMKQIAAPIYMSQTSKDKLMLDRAFALGYTVRTELMPGLWVTAIMTSHDCTGSIGFKIETERSCLGYITDLGFIPESTIALLSGSDCIVIESNHDEEMLYKGRYPWFLKKRILSDEGHLSNAACAAAISQFAANGTSHFFLAHLSEENNRPALALNCARAAAEDVNIEVLPPYGGGMFMVASRADLAGP